MGRASEAICDCSGAMIHGTLEIFYFSQNLVEQMLIFELLLLPPKEVHPEEFFLKISYFKAVLSVFHKG